MSASDLISRAKVRIEKRIEDGLPKAASILEESVRQQCPKDSGKLAASIEVTVQGDRLVASSPLPYAGIQNARSGFARKGLVAARDDIARAIMDGGK